MLCAIEEISAKVHLTTNLTANKQIAVQETGHVYDTKGYTAKGTATKNKIKRISELNIAFHDDRCGVADGVSICIINCDQASVRLRLPLCRSTGSRGARKPGSGVGGRANCGCIVACGAAQRPSGALASDAAEVGDELPEY